MGEDRTYSNLTKRVGWQSLDSCENSGYGPGVSLKTFPNLQLQPTYSYLTHPTQSNQPHATYSTARRWPSGIPAAVTWSRSSPLMRSHSPTTTVADVSARTTAASSTSKPRKSQPKPNSALTSSGLMLRVKSTRSSDRRPRCWTPPAPGPPPRSHPTARSAALWLILTSYFSFFLLHLLEWLKPFSLSLTRVKGWKGTNACGAAGCTNNAGGNTVAGAFCRGQDIPAERCCSEYEPPCRMC